VPLPILTSLERNREKTGRIRFVERCAGVWRPTRFVVLQVEEKFEWAQTFYPHPDDQYNYKTGTSWRDANPLDLSCPSLRWVIDNQPAELGANDEADEANE